MDHSNSIQQASPLLEPSQDNFLMSAFEQAALHNDIYQMQDVLSPDHIGQKLMHASVMPNVNPTYPGQFGTNALHAPVNMNSNFKTQFDKSHIDGQSQEIRPFEQTQALSIELAMAESKLAERKGSENQFIVAVEPDCDCNKAKCCNITACDLSDEEEAPATSAKQEVPEPKTKAITKYKRGERAIECGHTDRKMYAHGMCRNCYHSKGRTRTATDCPHTEKLLYARGMCKACYLRVFYRGEFKKEKLRKANEIKHKQFVDAGVQTDPM